MEIYRTFVGIPLKVDAGFLADLQRVMEILAGERISWVKPENFHLTLRFLGDTPAENISVLADALDRELQLPPPGNVTLDGPGVFGPRKKPRVLWVGFSDDEIFRRLRIQVDRALESCGIAPDAQGFNPHLTLGRIRSIRNVQGFYDSTASFTDHFRGEVRCDRLVFYRSILGPRGPEYKALRSWNFPF